MACGLWLMAYRWWLPFFGAGPPSTARPCAQPMLLVLTNLMLTLLFMKPTKCRPPPEVYSLQWCSQYMPGCRQSLRWNSGFQMDDVSPHFRWKIPWGTALKYIRSPARGGGLAGPRRTSSKPYVHSGQWELMYGDTPPRDRCRLRRRPTPFLRPCGPLLGPYGPKPAF